MVTENETRWGTFVMFMIYLIAVIIIVYLISVQTTKASPEKTEENKLYDILYPYGITRKTLKEDGIAKLIEQPMEQLVLKNPFGGEFISIEELKGQAYIIDFMRPK